jgi:hypothetical protein
LLFLIALVMVLGNFYVVLLFVLFVMGGCFGGVCGAGFGAGEGYGSSTFEGFV